MPDYLVTDPSTGQLIKMTGPAPPSEALIRLALAKVQPLPSHAGPEQNTPDFGGGPRWSEAAQANVGPNKGLGFLGPLKLPNGVMSELSEDGEINGMPVQYPLIVPTLNAGEVRSLMAGAKPTEAITRKAQQFAAQRIAAGKSPFAALGEQDLTIHPQIPRTSQTRDPLTALQGAQTIGPARVGERYQEDLNPSLVGIARKVLGGAQRPASVNAADPYGIEAWQKGAGPMPAPIMGETEGLYSRLDQAIAKLPDTKLPPMKILSTAKNATSGEEIAHRGLADFLQAAGGKPVARADVQAHLAANPIQLDVKVMGGGKNAFKVVTSSGLPDEAIQAFPRGEVPRFAVVNAENTPISFHQTYEAARSGLDELETMGIHGSGPAPKYSQYQVPGGTAYKETLITQPEKAPQALPKGYSIQPLTSNPNAKFALQSPDGSGWVLHAMTEEQAHAGALNRLQNEGIISKPENFRSSHFDQPNILVHVRSNERTLPSGEHGLFLEEVQSDWHQKGKAEGYQQPVPPESKMTWNEYAKSKGISPAEASQAFGDRSDPRFNDWMAHYEKGNEIGLANQKAVPDAPFKEQWPDLALKHQLLDAAKRPDLQWLGFTSGETQAARYDLSQTVDKIAWEPKIPAAGEGTMVSIYMPKNGSIPVKVPVGVDGKIGQTYQASAHQFEGKHLADVVGKDVADHIMGKASGELAGEGLNIGGKGMRFFYDNLLPKRLEKIVKPFGGTVERAPVSTLDPRTLPYGPFTGGTAPAWIVKLTPEMKQRILKEGLPLMTGVAAVAASQQEQK